MSLEAKSHVLNSKKSSCTQALSKTYGNSHIHVTHSKFDFTLSATQWNIYVDLIKIVTRTARVK